jgi:hypothetical protein
MNIKYLLLQIFKIVYPLIKRKIDIYDMEIHINLNKTIILKDQTYIKNRIYIGNYIFENSKYFDHVKIFSFNATGFRGMTHASFCSCESIIKFKLTNKKLYIWKKDTNKKWSEII